MSNNFINAAEYYMRSKMTKKKCKVCNDTGCSECGWNTEEQPAPYIAKSRIHVNSFNDRTELVKILANNGYTVRIVEEDIPYKVYGKNYFVEYWKD